MNVMFEERAAVLEHEAATKRLNAEIELQRIKCHAQEVESIRRWAFAEEDPAEDEWQKGYDAARAMVRALLPALPANVNLRGDPPALSAERPSPKEGSTT